MHYVGLLAAQFHVAEYNIFQISPNIALYSGNLSLDMHLYYNPLINKSSSLSFLKFWTTLLPPW